MTFNNEEVIVKLYDNPTSSDPSVGDLAYYSPWGNIAMYYKDARYAAGVIKLGKIESGVEKLENINPNVTVKIERINY